MTEFDFKLQLSNLENTKTATDFEAIIRKFIYPTKERPIEYTVRIITQALAGFRGRSKRALPDFIYEHVAMEIFKYLRTVLLENPNKNIWVSYEDFDFTMKFVEPYDLAKVVATPELVANLSKIATSNYVVLPTTVKLKPSTKYDKLFSTTSYSSSYRNGGYIAASNINASEDISNLIELAVRRLDLKPNETIFLDSVVHRIQVHISSEYTSKPLVTFEHMVVGLYKTLSSTIETIKTKTAECEASKLEAKNAS